MPDRSDRAARSDSKKDPPPNAPRADWRKKGTTSGTAAGKPPSSGPWSGRWTDRKPGDSNSGLLWHRLKLGAWGTLFLILVGGLFYYIFFLPTRVPLIAAAITDYGELIPPNSLAAEDVEGLAQANRSNMDVIGVPKDYSTREELRAFLRRKCPTCRSKISWVSQTFRPIDTARSFSSLLTQVAGRPVAGFRVSSPCSPNTEILRAEESTKIISVRICPFAVGTSLSHIW